MMRAAATGPANPGQCDRIDCGTSIASLYCSAIQIDADVLGPAATIDPAATTGE